MIKKPIKLFLILTIFFLGEQLQAQFGYGNRFGRQRSAIPQGPTAASQKEPEPMTAEEMVDVQMPKIIESLELDPFEQAVVRSTLIKYVQKRMELQILRLEPQKMKEEYEKLQVLQDADLKAGLPEEKYKTYLELVQNPSKTKRKKKKKKKSKSKE